MTPSPTLERLGRLWHRLSPLVGLALVGVAIWILGREVQQLSPQQLARSMRDFPPATLGLAALFTAVNYLILTGYDQLAFTYIGRRVSRWQIAMASFVGYAVANNVGFALLSGTSARYRFYSRWGLSGVEISRVVLFYSGTYWLGLLVLGGWRLVSNPSSGLGTLVPPWLTAATGVVLLAAAAAYPIAAVTRRRPFTVGGVSVELPRVPLVAAQFALSLLDWIVAAAVLYVLVPQPRPDFVFFVGVFIAAQLIGLASHVPGGLGVFESLVIVMLQLPASAALPALAMYRLIYYLLPLVVALGLLLADEVSHRRHLVVQLGNAFGTLTASLAPQVMAVFTLLAGGVLLVSGATPARGWRLAWLGSTVPLPAIEVSHFTASLAGFGLLVISWGILRRLSTAWRLAVRLLGLGIVLSLAKGLDYEEALALAALLGALALGRSEFHRRARVLEAPISPQWLAAIAVTVFVSIGAGLFMFRRVGYTPDLWWQFSLDGDAPRFLRASAAVFAAMAGVGIRQLLRPAPFALTRPAPHDLDAAAAIVAREAPAPAGVVLLGDKELLWSDRRDAFLMFGVHAHTWVALGDPVGPLESAAALVPRFLDRCVDYQAQPVFYEASKGWLPRYADFGLTFARLGEEARVFLPHFALEGAGRHRLKTTAEHVAREGATFRVVTPPLPPELLTQLEEVSSEWLAASGVLEHGFSEGCFHRDYVSRLAVALVERAGRVDAFATVWIADEGAEIAPDLVRHRSGAPRGTSQALVSWLMLWGRARGASWCSLGLAPTAGLESSPMAPLWSARGGPLHRHGETFASLAGVRAFVEQWDPAWEPRYFVYPGGLALPRILEDVAALVAERHAGPPERRRFRRG